MKRIGLISDTHGLMRPEALAFLQGCDHIVHGGDIGNATILEQLAAIAPVTAVRGNNDKAAWADAIAQTEFVQTEGITLYVLHDIADLDLDPPAAGIQVVMTGHSHKPLIEERDGVLYINPGSAGPRRFTLPISIGELVVEGTAITPRIVTLDIEASAR
jgi:putative phosphoesterase